MNKILKAMSLKKYIVIVIFFILTFGRDANFCSNKKISCLNKNAYQFCFKFNSTIFKISNIKYCPMGTICDEYHGKYACIQDLSIIKYKDANPPIFSTSPVNHVYLGNDGEQYSFTPIYTYPVTEINQININSDLQITTPINLDISAAAFEMDTNMKVSEIRTTEGQVDVPYITLGRPPQKKYTKNRKKINRGKLRKKTTSKGTTFTPEIQKTTKKSMKRIPTGINKPKNRTRIKNKNVNKSTVIASLGTSFRPKIRKTTFKENMISSTTKGPIGAHSSKKRIKTKNKNTFKSTVTASKATTTTKTSNASYQINNKNGPKISTTVDVFKITATENTLINANTAISIERPIQDIKYYFGSEIGSTTQLIPSYYTNSGTNVNYVLINLSYDIRNNMNISDVKIADHLLHPVKSDLDGTTNALREALATSNLETTTTDLEFIQPVKCTGPRKYASSKCNEYYECIKALWWYQPVLRKCQIEEKFDILTLTCVKDNNCII